MKNTILAFTVAATAAVSSFAVDYTWTGAADNQWTNAQNWNPSTGFPSNNADNATFPSLPVPTFVTVATSNSVKCIYFCNPNGTTVTIATDAILSLESSGALTLRAEEDATITGDGTITFSTGGGENWADNQAYPGKTLTITAQITGPNGFEHNGTGGDIILTHLGNTYAGATLTTAAGGITVPALPTALGTSSPLGKASIVKLNNGASYIRYTGGTVSTPLSFLHGAGANVDNTIDYIGDGILTITGAIYGNNNAHPLSLNIAQSLSVLNIAGTYANGGSGALALNKRGPGTLRISSATTHTGATTLHAGTIEVATNGNLSTSSALNLITGKLRFTANGTHAIGAVQINGITAIEIDPGVTAATVTLASLANPAGTIDFTAPGLGSTTKIMIGNRNTSGLLGPWATVNGGTDLAFYDNTDGIRPAGLAPQLLDARNDSVINDDPATIARIVTDAVTGGDITLDATTTRITALQHEINAPATVAMAGKTLVTPTVQLLPAAADLTLADGILTAPDAYLLLNNASSSSAATLTVNAAIADNGGTALKLAKTGTGNVALTGSVTHSGGTAIIDGTLTIANTAELIWPTGGISGNGTLAKAGDGNLIFPNVANTYTGATHITAGTLTVQHSDTLGTKTSPTYVTGTGALNLIGDGRNNELRLATETVYADGFGPDDNGALRNTGTNDQYRALRYLVLTGDLGIYNNKRLDIRNDGGTATLDLDGHGITKRGTDMFGLTGVTVTNDQGKSFIDIQQGGFTFETSTSLTGGTNNYVHISNGAYFDYYSIAALINWSLRADPGARLNVRSGLSTNINVWTGPVTLSGSTTFNADPAVSDTYTGEITGTGPIVKTGNHNGVTYLLNTNNTWTGGASIQDGVLYAATPGSLPGLGSEVTVTGHGTLALRVAGAAPATQPGFDLAYIQSLLAGTSILTTPTTAIGLDTAYADLNLSDPFPARGLRKFGPNTLTLSGTATDMGPVTVYNGTLDIPAHTRNLNYENITVGFATSTPDPIPTLSLRGDGGLTTIDRGSTIANQPILTIGDTGRGILRVTDDAHISGRLVVGNANGSAGAVYQTGGTVHNTGGHSNDGRIGMTGYGYYLLAGGSFTNNGYTQLGRDANGVGILRQTDGNFIFSRTHDGAIGISRGGTGLVRLEDGIFNHTSTIWLGNESDNSTTGGYSEFTLTDNADATVTGNIDMGNRNNHTSILNLNGGQLNANHIHRYDRTSSSAYVNWNGGLFRALNTDAELFTGNIAGLYPAVTLYDAGAIIDIPDGGKNKRVSAPLNAPAGLGITAIPIANRGSGYIGSPFIRIEGGGGTGASAYAHVDLENGGTLDRIEITSPGTGYTSQPTLTLVGGSPTTAATLGLPAMGYPPPGGLTKLGSGTLTLAAANTYTGPTDVQAGTLTLETPDAISPHSHITLNGGSLDLNGNTLTSAGITLKSGRISNGTLAATAINKTDPGILTLTAPLTRAVPVAAPALHPGLWEGVLPSSWDTATPNPRAAVQLTTTAANGGISSGNGTYAGGRWAGNNHTWVYSGYIWNNEPHDVTWTFFGRFDDNMLLLIDDTQVLRTGNSADVFASHTLTPGPHRFEARFGDGTGNVGPSGDLRPASGLLVDYSGQPGSTTDFSTRFKILQDPGDGTLFTLDSPDPITDGPGLFEYVIQEGNNTTGTGILISRQPTTRAANGPSASNNIYAGGIWTNSNHTWIYRGYIWNHSENTETWSFRGRFDDTHHLTINNNHIYSGGYSATSTADVPMKPGANAIEIRFGDTGGSVGPTEALATDPDTGAAIYVGIAYSTDGGATYRQLLDDGFGSLLTTTEDWPPAPAAPIDESSLVPVNITDGTLRLINNPAAGLREGSIANNSDANRNLTNENAGTTIELTTTAANGNCENANQYINGKLWPAYTTYIYTGFIWNRGPDAWWTFAEHFDDDVYLIIDGNTDNPVLNDGTWSAPTKKNVWITHGHHSFEIRFGQGTGGCASPGGTAPIWWNRELSFGVDFNGNDILEDTYFQKLEDPGNGTLLTWTLDELPRTELLAQAQVNLGGAGTLDLFADTHQVSLITGTGTVTNGTLGAGSVISPAGDADTGILKLEGVTFAGPVQYHVTADGTDSDCLTSTGALDVTGLVVIPADGTVLTAVTYVIARADGGITGKATLGAGVPSKYKLMRKGNELWLTSLGGTVMILK